MVILSGETPPAAVLVTFSSDFGDMLGRFFLFFRGGERELVEVLIGGGFGV